MLETQNGKAERFLIIQTAFIGDVVLMTSLIESLGNSNPNAMIDVLVRKGNEQVLDNNPNIERVITWEKRKNKFLNLFKLIREIRSLRYDYIINVHRFFSSGLISFLGGARQTIGFDKNPLSFFYSIAVQYKSAEGYHEINRNVSLLESVCKVQLVKPKMYPSTNDFDKVIYLKKDPYYCIAPASVWFTKQYPKEHWVRLIRSSKHSVYLIGGQGDMSLCEGIKSEANMGNVQNLAGKLSFLETAALMKDALMNFVNDSAPLHIASAMNAPVTAYFCSTVPAFGFGPLSDHSVIMESQDSLSCRPCGLHGKHKCPELHFQCAHSIPSIDLKNSMEQNV